MKAINSNSTHTINSIKFDPQIDLKYRIDICWNNLNFKNKINASKMNGKSVHYEGPANSNLPAASNVFYSLHDGYHAIKNLKRAINQKDHESVTDSVLRLGGTPFSFLNGVGNAAYYGNLLKVIEFTLIPLIAFTFVFGIILCSIEIVVEGIGIKRELSFEKQWIKPIAHLLKKDILHESDQQMIIDHLEKLRTENFELSEKDLVYIQKMARPDMADKEIKRLVKGAYRSKVGFLARRVHITYANKLNAEIPKLLIQMKKGTLTERADGMHRSIELLKGMDIQKTKKIILHAIGILALTVTMIGLILGLIGCPGLIVLLLLIIGFAVGTTRLLVARGLLPTTGWQFSFSQILSEKLRNQLTN